MYVDYALRSGLTGTQTALPGAAFQTTRPGSFWGRMLDKFVESRLRKAEQEIRMHLQFVPEDVLKRSGYLAKLGASKDLPFARR